MSYNQDFFEQYSDYLQEPQVRNVHDWMFRIFEKTFPQWKYPFNIIDFGCGQCLEFRRYGLWAGYVGLDLDPPVNPWTLRCDYTKISAEEVKKIANMPLYGFVSLFSTECCMSAAEKYAFYKKLFEEYDFDVGLVSGFYYKEKIKGEKISETGGIVSYQTIEDQKEYVQKRFIEMRTCVNVPSKMFGPDVVEVWKLLIRKSAHVN